MAQISSKVGEERHIKKEATVTAAAGTHAVNLFQLTGAVRIISQVGIITEVTTLTNMTAVYADLWDGTNSELLTANGATLSGATVGSILTKDQDTSNPYSVLLADQCRVSEVISDRNIGKPFTVVQKNVTNTYMRIRFTTTDDPISFKMFLHFCWEPLDGGNLVPLF